MHAMSENQKRRIDIESPSSSRIESKKKRLDVGYETKSFIFTLVLRCFLYVIYCKVHRYKIFAMDKNMKKTFFTRDEKSV